MQPKEKMTKLANHRKVKEEMHRQIALAKEYKFKIQETLQSFDNQLHSGVIDKKTYLEEVSNFLQGKSAEEWYFKYDQFIEECHSKIHESNEKIQQISKLSFNPIAFIFLILFVATALTTLVITKPELTGFSIYSPEENSVIFEDGYKTEGSRWAEIRGADIYERCLKVTSAIDFNSVEIKGKITNARDDSGLVLKLYTSNGLDDEPLNLVDSCTVKEYSDVFKSCIVKDLEQPKGDYWICASHPSGESGLVYHTMAFKIGSERRTALWTGENWQKLDGTSYTIKALFKGRQEQNAPQN